MIKHSKLGLWALVVALLLSVPLLGGASSASASAAHVAVRTSQVQGHVTANPHPSNCCHVTIPADYDYNPSKGTLHDYCTKSPDSFLGADFRGPCARHDLCYMRKNAPRSTCDSQLYRHLSEECTYTFTHWYDPRGGLCQDAASVYYVAVVANTFWSSL